MARSIETRLVKLEEANAPTLEDLEYEQFMRESQARVAVIEQKYFELTGETMPPYEPEEPPPGLTDSERDTWRSARIAAIDARLAELRALRDTP
jgi:hypothetical protein